MTDQLVNIQLPPDGQYSVAVDSDPKWSGAAFRLRDVRQGCSGVMMTGLDPRPVLGVLARPPARSTAYMPPDKRFPNWRYPVARQPPGRKPVVDQV
jgi:hypothetical protein